MKYCVLTSLAFYCILTLPVPAIQGEEAAVLSECETARAGQGQTGEASGKNVDNEAQKRPIQPASLSPILADDAFQRILKYSAMLLQSDMKDPLRFTIHTPTVEEIESRLGVAACGHVCNGNVCYEDDSVADTPSPSDIQADSIVIHDDAPPMPMLILNKSENTPKSGKDTPAEVVLNAPITAQVRSLEVENAELKAELIALKNEIELRKEYEKEVRDLIAANTELSIQVAELSATQKASEGLMDLLIEKNQLAVELASMHSSAVNNTVPPKYCEAGSDAFVTEKIGLLVQMIEALHRDVHAMAGKSTPVSKRSTMPVPLGPSNLIPVDFFGLENCESGCTTHSAPLQNDTSTPAKIASEVGPSTNK